MLPISVAINCFSKLCHPHALTLCDFASPPSMSRVCSLPLCIQTGFFQSLITNAMEISDSAGLKKGLAAAVYISRFPGSTGKFLNISTIGILG